MCIYIIFSYDCSYGGIAAPYNNAERQEYVNHKAEYKGASSGTARWINRFTDEEIVYAFCSFWQILWTAIFLKDIILLSYRYEGVPGTGNNFGYYGYNRHNNGYGYGRRGGYGGYGNDHYGH